jgi:hypothetical protein
MFLPFAYTGGYVNEFTITMYLSKHAGVKPCSHMMFSRRSGT